MSRNRVFPSRLDFIPASAGDCTTGRAYAAQSRAVSRGSKKLLRVVNSEIHLGTQKISSSHEKAQKIPLYLLCFFVALLVHYETPDDGGTGSGVGPPAANAKRRWRRSIDRAASTKSIKGK